MHVSLMITCLGDAFFPDVGVATVTLLRRLGVTVDFPQAQTCCGQPHFNSGYHDEPATWPATPSPPSPIRRWSSRRRAPVPRWSSSNIRSCFTMIPVWHARAVELAHRTHELSDFLVNVLKVDDVGARFDGKRHLSHGVPPARPGPFDGADSLDSEGARLAIRPAGTLR